MKIFGLVGEKLPHSFSKEIHEKLWAKTYELIELKKEEVEPFFKKRKFKGVNVTIPYKVDALDNCDYIEENASLIGCVNTVVKRNGILYGYNTDYDGFLYCAKRAGINFENKNVLILGSGATSKTVFVAVKNSGAKTVCKVSRSGEINYDNIYNKEEAQVIVNTAPVGMYPNNFESLVDLSRFKNLESFIDVVYNPLRTKTYLQAKSLGLKCTCGLPMLVAQAVYVAKLFCKKEFEEKVIEDCIKAIEKEKENIVLVGMPGCGKTTIGKAVAKKLSREFFDSDIYLEEKEGMSIPEIFQKYGEEHFRNLETQAIKELSLKSGVVIATGGGAPLREENRNALLQNGKVYFIKRELELLATNGRPLSKDLEALKAMYEKREPVYKSFAAKVLDNNKEFEKCAEEIWSEFI